MQNEKNVVFIYYDRIVKKKRGEREALVLLSKEGNKNE